jgi:uncharacterized protein (DUF2062 family)
LIKKEGWVVFKRRDKRPIVDIVLRFFWPKGGWGRAFYYIKHRLHRLPDTPQRIARGIWAGVYTTFTPFYGFHFIHAAAVARLMNGNILAALLATFFGNPLTYLPIGIVSLKTGHFILGTEYSHDVQHKASFIQKFVDAGHDLKANFLSLFNGDSPDWTNLITFYNEVFLPYWVGGIIPGIIVSTIFYIVSVPLIRAYQNRRRGVLKAKLLSIKKKKAEHSAD